MSTALEGWREWARRGNVLEMEVSRRNAVTNEEPMAATVLLKLDIAYKIAIEPIEWAIAQSRHAIQDTHFKLLRLMVIAWLIGRQRI